MADEINLPHDNLEKLEMFDEEYKLIEEMMCTEQNGSCTTSTWQIVNIYSNLYKNRFYKYSMENQCAKFFLSKPELLYDQILYGVKMPEQFEDPTNGWSIGNGFYLTDYFNLAAAVTNSHRTDPKKVFVSVAGVALGKMKIFETGEIVLNKGGGVPKYYNSVTLRGVFDQTDYNYIYHGNHEYRVNVGKWQVNLERVSDELSNTIYYVQQPHQIDILYVIEAEAVEKKPKGSQ